MNSRRTRAIQFGTLALTSGLAVIYLWGALDGSPRPAGFGNSPENVERIRSAPSYRFVVVGDPQNEPEMLARMLRSAKDPAFVIVVGDLVHYSQPWTWRYFFHRFPRDVTVPVFSAVGNHDLSWWMATRRSQYALFREHVGPVNFHFTHRGSLFVILDNANGPMADGTGAWLRGVLDRHRSAEHVFLFAHCPLVRYDEKASIHEPPGAPADPELWEIVRTSGVRYFCTGHVHSYRRAALENGTVHLVTVGGGGGLHGVDAFHHYVEFEVDGPRVSDRVVRMDPPGFATVALQDFRKAVVRDVYLRLRCQPELEIALLGSCALALLAVVLGAVQGRRRKPPKP